MQQPPYYQQPTFNYPPPPPKKRGWFRRHPFWTALIILLCVSAIYGVVNDATTSTKPDATTTPIATNIPTQPPATVKPTATPKPVPTQTPVQRIQSQTSQLASDSTEFGSNISSKDTNGAVTITETMGTALDNNGAKIQIETDCFNIQKAIWQKSVTGVTGVTVKVMTQLTDPYGKQSTGLVGACSLSDINAKQFHWENLDWRTTWDNGDYDVIYLLPSLNN
jgi:hypothetical protein